MSGLVTLGEQMGQVNASLEGPLRPGAPAVLSVCGAEATVAIGVRRLGFDATYFGRVGADAFGRMAVDVLRGEGVDVAHVVVDTSAPTGLLIRARRTADRTVVEYLRAGSAGARLSPDDIDDAKVRAADLLHISGITPALGPSPAKATEHAVSVARDAGVPISFDVNYRATLWSRADAAAVLLPFAESADVVIGGRSELALLGGDDGSAEDVMRRVAALGPCEVVMTRGAAGAAALLDGRMHSLDAHPVRPVDVVGAGDAFVAGYLAARLGGRPIEERLRLGVTLGAFAVTTRGDWEGLPRRAELGLFDHADDVLR